MLQSRLTPSTCLRATVNVLYGLPLINRPHPFGWLLVYVCLHVLLLWGPLHRWSLVALRNTSGFFISCWYRHWHYIGSIEPSWLCMDNTWPSSFNTWKFAINVQTRLLLPPWIEFHFPLRTNLERWREWMDSVLSISCRIDEISDLREKCQLYWFSSHILGRPAHPVHVDL
ncbi:hypothetical protein Mapa_015584 [Marchantia paleacea]|nr:hypothetical protein Mapa_015584 [Marchantia paleacea]